MCIPFILLSHLLVEGESKYHIVDMSAGLHTVDYFCPIKPDLLFSYSDPSSKQRMQLKVYSLVYEKGNVHHLCGCNDPLRNSLSWCSIKVLKLSKACYHSNI